MAKEWGSILGDALNESGDLKDAIVGGVSERMARAAVERVISDHNFFMPTCDAIELATSSAGAEYISELGGLSEVVRSDDNLNDVCERVAEGTAYRLVYDATTVELDELLGTLDDVETDGYTIEDLGTGSCVLGMLPHQSEADEYGGCLAYWRRPEGGPDARVLYLTIGDSRVWFRLSKDEDDAEEA